MMIISLFKESRSHLFQYLCFSHCLRQPDQTNPIKVKIKSHMDGTTSLKWPIFSVNFALVHQPHLFDLESISFAKLTELEIQTIGILKETCLTVRDCTKILGNQLLTIMEPVNYGILS